MDLLKDIPQPVMVLIVAIFAWFFKDVWDTRKKTIEKNSDVTQQNTMALVELRVELRSIKELMGSFSSRIEKAEKDINVLHDYKRKVDNGL